MNSQKTNIGHSSCTNILKFWHKVEFFIPFDLQRQVLEAKDAEWSVRTFSEMQLNEADSGMLWRVTPPVGHQLCGFEVYLGIFDKRELTEMTCRVVHETLTQEDELDQEERGELEGRTCFARIKVSAQGEPLLDDVSVSTAPWALGCIQQQGLAGLDFDAFQSEIETLKDELKNFRAKRAKETSSDPSKDSVAGEPQSSPSRPLTGSELSALLKIFYGWASYQPTHSTPDSPAIVIRAKSVAEQTKKPANKDKASPTRDGESDTDDQDEETASAENSEIDILNSFYAQDIARSIAALERGMSSPALESYLTPQVPSARIDLYQSAGRKRIVSGLKPDRLNSGHWLDRPCHAMSLMQQFAINSVFEQLAQTGVFSVNGPPGTGKTTLLRDIFAENIVRRARALAKFEMSGDAFLPESATVNFMGAEKPCKVAQLREEIAGFEMVVASSNNAAVENISRDLPKTKSLGKAEKPGEPRWRDAQGKATVGYLQQVAHNVAARNSKGEYENLSPDDEPWGLISCALGKKSNRTAFVERISFAGAKPSEKAPKGFDPERHQSLWTWRKCYKGIGYSQARIDFLKVDQEVKSMILQLDRYAKLHAELQGQTEASFTAAEAQSERQAQQAFAIAQAALNASENEQTHCDSQFALLKSEEKIIETRRPKWLWWAQLRKRQDYLDYSNDLATNHRRQGEWLHRKYETAESRRSAQKNAGLASAVYTQTQRSLSQRQAAWQAKQNELERFTKAFPQAACPEESDDLEQECWQIDGFWRDETLNAKRAELFAAALQLHEAWLADVLQTGGRFGGNVVAFCHMLSGKRLQETQHALAIWRSLFMVVPVVSSTFASFASQFRDLGANAFGWLFIDEAGQAVPQAAVGALWRAKRAVVVGDPLQIEPVFTVPIKLIEALSKSSILPPNSDVAPHRVSVQNLADAANPLGAWIGTGQDVQWIGSPLRVHRRCVDPMFSIANEIAYAGKMIFFDPADPQKRLPPKDSLDLGNSAWVHAPGQTNNKQAVSTQIELVHQALVTLYQRTGTLPPIYIISPFKRIKDELIGRISKQENWTTVASAGVEPPKKSKLQEWCKARIGTVHTFQGKEESIVWMVLGCDDRTRGAANWAAGKPNLLNVALTRAKHRFFMIGDASLWGGLCHFDAANSELLPRTSADEFLQRMEQ